MNSAIRKEANRQGLTIKHIGGMVEVRQNKTVIMRSRGLREVGAMMREEETAQRANLKRLRQWGNVGKIG
jgi:hypothetical protein